MKRVLTIQDISCLGRCSITIALPVISSMGVETSILPTALLSTHSLFRDFTFCDLSGQMEPVTGHWKKEKVPFDAIYTGYLGSIREIGTVEKIIDEFRSPDMIVFVDPVMGDNGKLYAGFDDAYVRRNASLCAKADIIVPNITEACFLTGREYLASYNEDHIRDLLKALSGLGARINVLTGVSLSEGKTGIMGYDAERDSFFSYQNDKVAASFHGTGDLFSSSCVGALMNGLSWQEAFKLAADYTAVTISRTIIDIDNTRSGDPASLSCDPRFGVHFESTIPDLIRMLRTACG